MHEGGDIYFGQIEIGSNAKTVHFGGVVKH